MRHLSQGGDGRAQAIESLGIVDQFVLWDQLTSWWPQALWRPETAPLASLLLDVDTCPDPFAVAAFGLAGVEKTACDLHDAARREPAELAQTMLPLALATEGRGTLSLGAGEVRHIAVGRKRSIGLRGTPPPAAASTRTAGPRGHRGRHARDWHYAFDMMPASMARAEIDAIIDQVTPQDVLLRHLGRRRRPDPPLRRGRL